MCSRDGMFSAEFGKRTRSCVMLERKQLQDHFFIASSSRPCVASLLALFRICLVLAAAPPHYPFLPLSLNSLDLAGVRLLSPRDSQILPKTVAGADDTSAGDATELKWELDEALVRCVVSFPVDQ